MEFPSICDAEKLTDKKKRLYIAAYGFEDRELGWANLQLSSGPILEQALIFHYLHAKGENRIQELRELINKIGVASPLGVNYDVNSPYRIEYTVEEKLIQLNNRYEEIILDVSAMTKLLILICLCKLREFNGCLRIIYSEACENSPTKAEYELSKQDMRLAAKFPTHGIESIIRTKCLSSVRMQGQPVTLIAFTSFNEQLVRHMLGTISPHRLIFINGKVHERQDYCWRHIAAQEIHGSLISEYKLDNPLDADGRLIRTASIVNYWETIQQIDEIYRQYGTFERIICAATGSKMQTVGLFFSKAIHSDIHVEYPTPDSYYVEGHAKGVRKVHEVIIANFADFLSRIQRNFRTVSQNEELVV